MSKVNILEMKFSKVYPLLINKAINKGRTKEEVDKVIYWLTGYEAEAWDKEASYQDFFEKAPKLNLNYRLIKGTICQIKLETIEDPLIRKIRVLDKLIDDLAKGKCLEKILK